MARGPASKLLLGTPVTESCSSSRFDVFEQAHAACRASEAEANALPRMSVVRTPCVMFDTDRVSPTQTCWISRGPYPRIRLPILLFCEMVPALIEKGSGQGSAGDGRNLNLPFRPVQFLQTSPIGFSGKEVH